MSNPSAPLYPRPAHLVLLIAFVAALVALSLYHYNPPAPVAADAPPAEFSSGRALRDLRAHWQTAHPTGSEENARVRDFLLSRLTELGTSPEVQQGVGVAGQRGLVGQVQNVVARLKGTDSTKALLLASHYDSTVMGPGASDDGAAVVAMLETLRALRGGPPLRNDVILLFTDGEELGLLGAALFAARHPWAADVGAVLNFEARGVGGPSVMFETGADNGRLVSEFAAGAPHPLANSLMYEFYKVLPNDTDMTVFKEAGLTGLNFAYIGGHTHYHTRLDTPENLDERSLQHHGSHMLALTRRLGGLDLRDARAPDRVFFDLPGLGLVHYPVSFAVPLAALAALLYLAAAALALRRKRLTFAGLGLGFLLSLFLTAASAAAVFLLWRGVLSVHGGYRWFAAGSTYNGQLYLISFVSLTVAIAAALYATFGARLGANGLAFGGLLIWLLLLAPVSVYMPGGGFLFTLPLMASLVALSFVNAGREAGGRARTREVVALCLGAAPGLLLLPPFIRLVYVGLTPRMGWAAAVFVALLVCTLAPHFALLTSRRRWLLPCAAAAVCVAFLVAGGLTSGFDAQHPKPNTIIYALDADAGRAEWLTTDPAPDEWTSQFFEEGAERGALPLFIRTQPGGLLKGRAPSVALEAPRAELLGEQSAAGVRTLRLRVTSPRGAPFITIFTDRGTSVRGASLGGESLSWARDRPEPGAEWGWRLRYHMPPPGGFELTLDVTSDAPFKVTVIDRSHPLPDIQGFQVRPRPDSMMPSPSWLNGSTMVAKSYTF